MINFILENFDTIFKNKTSLETLDKVILDLAIKGKLVEQNQDDEPASELIKRIKAEKQRLIDEKVIKKEKPLPPIEDEEIPFDIPSSWEVERLGKLLLSVTKGATPTTYGFSFQDKGINFLKVENVKNGIVVKDSIKTFISEEANIFQKRSQLEEGDILFSIAGTIGETCIIKKEYLPANTNQAFAILRGGKIVFELGFLKLLLNSLVLKKAKSLARGGAMNNISLEDIKKMIVLIPPIEEQKRIVSKVEKLQSIIKDLKEIYIKNQNNRENLKKSLLSEIESQSSDKDLLKSLETVFTNFDKIIKTKEDIKDIRNLILSLAIKGKLVEQNQDDEKASELLKRIKAEKQRLIDEKVIKREKPLPPIEDEEIPFDIPNNWEWVRLEDIILKIKYGYTASAETAGEVKFLRITDIQNNSVDWNSVPYCAISLEEYENYKLEKRDILIARTGGTVGKTFLIENDLKNMKSVYASYLISIKPSINIDEKYLKNYFDTPLYWRLIKEKSQGTGQPNVNAPSLKSLSIPLPPIEEQKRIVSKVESLMKICDLLEEKITLNEKISENLLLSFIK